MYHLVTHLVNISQIYRPCIDLARIDTQHATGCCTIQPLPATPAYKMRKRILYEGHDTPPYGHRGREKTYLTVSRDFYWPRQHQFVRNYILAYEVCQRVKPSPFIACATTASINPGRVLVVCFNGLLLRFLRRRSPE